MLRLMKPQGFWSMVSVLAMSVAGIACGNDDSSSPTATQNSAPIGAITWEAARIPDIVEQLKPSVVQVQTEETIRDIFGQPDLQRGVGTGFIIDKEGHIITNNHVVRLGGDRIAQRITVALSDGRTFNAQVIGTDPLTDLAVIKIDAPNLTPVKLGKSEALRVGETVVAIGHALGLEGGPTVSAGVVSAKDRSLEESDRVQLVGLIQTDAAINPGNSGGPLVNTNAEVIGINTARIPGSTVEGISFAIAIDNAKPIVEELIAKGRVERGFLGINPVNITPALAAANRLPVTSGVGVASVNANSPAARAGLQPGDIIVRIGEQKIDNRGDLVRALVQYRAGERVNVEFYRGSDKRTVEVTIGSVS